MGPPPLDTAQLYESVPALKDALQLLARNQAMQLAMTKPGMSCFHLF